jgi:hypothetical protein
LISKLSFLFFLSLDKLPTKPVKVFVSPELSEIKKIQVLHFPREPVSLNSIVDFIVKKNQTRGNVEVKLRYSTKNVHITEVPLQVIDADRYSVRFQPRHSGPLDVIVKFNGVDIPQSPLRLTVMADNFAESTKISERKIFYQIKSNSNLFRATDA